MDASHRIFATAFVAALLAFSVPSHADDTGMAGMHAWQRVGRLTCFVDHTHYASSSGQKDKKSAMAEAAKSWAEFTAWEYGTVWANFGKATAKRFSCTQSTGGWGCDLEARPCR